MRNKISAACLAMAMANILILFFVYGQSTSGEDKAAAQSVARLISSYAEPDANPLGLIRSEDRCRFYGDQYCPAAKSQRQVALSAMTRPTVVSKRMATNPHYNDYLTAQQLLAASTAQYAGVLNNQPPTREYVLASAAFETEANQLLGTIISNLYALQEQTLQESDNNSNWAFALGYICNALLIALIALKHWNLRKRQTKGS